MVYVPLLLVAALSACVGRDAGPCPPPPVVCDLPPGQSSCSCNGCDEVWCCDGEGAGGESVWLFTGFECDCLDSEGGIDSDACPSTW